jgi:hypothetical protein
MSGQFAIAVDRAGLADRQIIWIVSRYVGGFRRMQANWI